MIEIISLGGSGQDSRICFLVKSSKKNFLIDCGVKRELANANTVYPSLTKSIVNEIDYVFISHAHEDHSAALGYLYELGYRKSIYASIETIKNIPLFCNKWIKYVEDNHGDLPFDKNNISRLDLKPLEEFKDFPISYGKSGHILGSVWLKFDIDNKTILYTGDMTNDSLLLESDPLPKADILIIDSAYANKTLNQYNQYNKILDIVKNTQNNNGTTLLPIPTNGRGIDLCEFLKQNHINVLIEEKLYSNSKDLFNQKNWIKKSEFINDHYTIVNDNNRDSLLNKPQVILFGDGMMTTKIAKYYYDKIKTESNSTIIITGHQAKGTLGYNLMQDNYVIDNNIKCSINNITIKVHFDMDDVLNQIINVCPSYVVLFHSNKTNCIELIDKIQNSNIQVLCDTNISLII